MRLVLASASPARLKTLRAAGLDPEVQVSGVDESQVTETNPATLATELATRKARTVAAGLEDAWVVGCDSVLEIDGQVHGKPGDPEAARRRWHAMRGRSGVLHTGHCVIDTGTGREVVRAARTVVRFAAVTDAEIDAYVTTGEPLEVAGAFIDGVEGDPHTVVGISLPLLRRMLAELGVRWTDLWAPAVVGASEGD